MDSASFLKENQILEPVFGELKGLAAQCKILAVVAVKCSGGFGVNRVWCFTILQPEERAMYLVREILEALRLGLP